MGTKKKEELAQVELNPGDSARIVTQMLAVRGISQDADINDPNTLYTCFMNYVDLCMNHDIRVTNLGAAAALGITQNDLKGWASGRLRSKDKRYKELAQMILGFCAEYREMLMAEGKISPILGIWWQKVYEHYSDIVPPQAETTSALGESHTAEEIAEKYKHLPE